MINKLYKRNWLLKISNGSRQPCSYTKKAPTVIVTEASFSPSPHSLHNAKYGQQMLKFTTSPSHSYYSRGLAKLCSGFTDALNTYSSRQPLSISNTESYLLKLWQWCFQKGPIQTQKPVEHTHLYNH